MLILTPRGQRHMQDMDAGDEVLSRDAMTGRLLCNRMETRPQWVDSTEFARWHGRPMPFRFFRINNQIILSRSQSIWANGFITHVALLKVGDVIYTERGGFVRVHRIEDVRRDGWWRCDVDGDHSYILDGALVHNASRFWVGGTGSLDGSTTTHIAATSNGAGGASYPGSADTLTLDANSGGGTVTFAADHTIQSITMSNFVGTLDNAANDNNITLNTTTTALNASGTAVQTINLGDGLWNVTNGTANWNTSGSNLTLNANGSTLRFSAGNNATERVVTLSKTYNIVDFAAASNFRTGGGSTAIGTLMLAAGVRLAVLTPTTINNITSTATPSSPVSLMGGTVGSASVINGDGAYTLANFVLRDLSFSGGSTRIANNSFDLQNVSGIQINPTRTTHISTQTLVS
jgi:hypothetical protein